MSSRICFQATLLIVGNAIAVFGCGTQPPPGSVLVHVDTDAPLPSDPNTPAAAEVPPVFDTLQVVAITGLDQRVPGTEHQMDLTADMFANGPISFAVVPANPTEQVVLQMVLLRKAHLASSFSPETTDLAVRVNLPAVGEEGQKDAFVFLHTDDTGQRKGWGQPDEPRFKVPVVSKIGSWRGAKRVACPAPAETGEVCVPGGAFWMGDPGLRGNVDLGDSDRERLVIVSPFYMDVKEVTVGEFRSVLPALKERGLDPPPSFSAKSTGTDPNDFSTFTEAPPEGMPDTHSDLPVNGVSWPAAQVYCQEQGKDLPSEAMFEFVASGRGKETDYVWGVDPPDCKDTIIARAGVGAYLNQDGSCRAPGTIGGPEVFGSGKRDLTRMNADPGSTIYDLAGNLSEWMLDVWTPQEDLPEQLGPEIDPVATGGRDPKIHVAKGGSWRGRLVGARAGARGPTDGTVENRSMGFRCAHR